MQSAGICFIKLGVVTLCAGERCKFLGLYVEEF